MCPLTGLILIIAYSEFTVQSIDGALSHSETLRDQIDSLVDRFRQELKIPGVAVGIVVDGQTVLAKGYGLRNRTDPESQVTERTVFAIGSLTKAFTTFILDTLVNVDGSLAWDDLVSKHLSEFRMWNTDTTSRINVKDLVTHVSGLPRHDQAWLHANFSRNEWLARIPHLRTNYGLREVYQYNNVMYTVAGMLIERVTKKSWEDNVDERISQPLNMTRTFSGGLTEALSKKVDDISCPHHTSPTSKEAVIIPWLNSHPIAPAGGILSSAEDITKWIQLQLRLSGPSKEMHTPQVAIPSDPTADAPFAYGLGWELRYRRGRYLVSHSGGMDGFLSFIILCEEEKFGVVVLANVDDDSVYDAIEKLSLRITDIMTNYSSGSERDDVEWLSKVKLEKSLAEKVRENKQKSYALEVDREVQRPQQFVGHYENGGYGEVEILITDTRLFASYNNVLYTLHPKETADFFSARSPFPSEFRFGCSFVRDSSGDVYVLRFDLEPKENLWPIIFTRKISKDLFQLEYLEKFVGIYEHAVTSERINVRVNEGKRFLIASRGLQYAGKLKPFKRNWFRLHRSPYDFYNSLESRSSFEFVANNGSIFELREHECEETDVYVRKAE